jgi:sec-independent protein translocase protein TatC
MPSDNDLFAEEQSMPAMSFGEHLEELRRHLILAILGLAVGVVITFLPPLNLGMAVMKSMELPAQKALKDFYARRAEERAAEATAAKAVSPPVEMSVDAADLFRQMRELAPALPLPRDEVVKGKAVTLRMRISEADLIQNVARTIEPKSALISLGPLESITIFMMVCFVTGLTIASPWVFYQVWAFVAAGLYRHERHYVKKFLPFSLGLFLAGVFLCYFGVLPITLQFLLQFNVWLGIEPTMQISEWMSFATILPLVFGLCFQTPLIMLFLARLGIFTAADFRAKRKIAILVMVIAAAVLTPGPDVSSQLLLALPMIGLYELGILLVGDKKGVLQRVSEIG